MVSDESGPMGRWDGIMNNWKLDPFVPRRDVLRVPLLVKDRVDDPSL